MNKSGNYGIARLLGLPPFRPGAQRGGVSRKPCAEPAQGFQERF